MSNYFASVKRAESGGNLRAKNPLSSATGPYQFIDSTWRGLIDRHPDLGLTPDGRFDAEQNERAIRAFTGENAGALRRGGLDTSPANLYAAHFLGAGGALSVLTQPDSTPLASILSEQVLAVNPNLRGMTVADFKAFAAKSGGGAPYVASDVNALPAQGGAEQPQQLEPKPFEPKPIENDPAAFMQNPNALMAFAQPITMPKNRNFLTRAR